LNNAAETLEVTDFSSFPAIISFHPLGLHSKVYYNLGPKTAHI
jgi:hypothetical protein